MIHQPLSKCMILGIAVVAAPSLHADVRPNPLFSDGAVLQRSQPVSVWGTARNGEKVTVEFDGQKVGTTTANGKWNVSLKPLEAGGPFTMTITGDNVVTAKDLLVGDDRTQPVLPLRGGKPKSWSNEYVRHGTQTMLAAIEIESGKATTWVNKTRKAEDFITFMDRVVREYPEQRLCVVMDNLNTHKGKLAQEWLDENPLVSFHYTPTHASWVNLAECFFSIMTRQGLQQSVHRSNKELVRFLKDYVSEYNKSCGPFVWTKGPEKLRRIIQLTQSYQSQTHTH